jgi:hypothetical protein
MPVLIFCCHFSPWSRWWVTCSTPPASILMAGLRKHRFQTYFFLSFPTSYEETFPHDLAAFLKMYLWEKICPLASEHSEEYVNCGFFLLPFSWISVRGFPDFPREEIYGRHGYVITCTILFFKPTNLAHFCCSVMYYTVVQLHIFTSPSCVFFPKCFANWLSVTLTMKIIRIVTWSIIITLCNMIIIFFAFYED